MPLRKLLTAILLLCCQFAWADAADHYNRVTFESGARREVPNDLVVVQLSIEINDKNPEHIAQQISARLNAALKTAESYPAVKASSGDQYTETVYNKKNQFIGYRGHGEIRLESRDFKATAKLIATLQAGMRLAGMWFYVSPETRRQVESELIAEAVNNYKRRAGEMSVLLYGNGSSYKLVSQEIHPGVDVPAGGVGEPPPVLKLAAGTSRIRVEITSVIEVAPPAVR